MQRNCLKLDGDHWYEHVPKFVETSHEGKVTMLWSQQVQSNRILPNNKPDIIILDRAKENACE
jgi:hypothetical protein